MLLSHLTEIMIYRIFSTIPCLASNSPVSIRPLIKLQFLFILGYLPLFLSGNFSFSKNCSPRKVWCKFMCLLLNWGEAMQMSRKNTDCEVRQLGSFSTSSSILGQITRISTPLFLHSDFPGGCIKEPVHQCRSRGFDPWVVKILGRRKRQPTPLFSPG